MTSKLPFADLYILQNIACSTVLLLLQVKKIASIILLIWILAIAAVLPITFATGIFVFHFADTPLVMKEICMEMWPAPSLHLTYSVLLMIVQVTTFSVFHFFDCPLDDKLN